VLWPVWLLGPGVPIDPDPAGAEARITFGDVLPGMVPDVLVVCGISSDEQYLENSQKKFFFLEKILFYIFAARCRCFKIFSSSLTFQTY
jgi:hypothetical protein